MLLRLNYERKTKMVDLENVVLNKCLDGLHNELRKYKDAFQIFIKSICSFVLEQDNRSILNLTKDINLLSWALDGEITKNKDFRLQPDEKILLNNFDLYSSLNDKYTRFADCYETFYESYEFVILKYCTYMDQFFSFILGSVNKSNKNLSNEPKSFLENLFNIGLNELENDFLNYKELRIYRNNITHNNGETDLKIMEKLGLKGEKSTFDFMRINFDKGFIYCKSCVRIIYIISQRVKIIDDFWDNYKEHPIVIDLNLTERDVKVA